MTLGAADDVDGGGEGGDAGSCSMGGDATAVCCATSAIRFKICGRFGTSAVLASASVCTAAIIPLNPSLKAPSCAAIVLPFKACIVFNKGSKPNERVSR